MIRTVYAGRDKLVVPDGWCSFTWHGRTYRVAGPGVEFWSPSQHAWVPSLLLHVSAPKGRAA
jgi:hypothetical protein